MRTRNQTNQLAISIMVSMLACTLSESAFGQAWVGEPNSLSASFAYNFSPATKIIETEGQVLEGRTNQHHYWLFGLEYVTPLPGLAIDATLPLIGVKASSGTQGVAHGAYDDHEFHVVLTDLRFGARYMLPFEEYLALALHVSGTIPLTDYEVLGWTATGRHLKQLHAGLSIGRTLEPFLPNLYFHARYEFTLSERFKTDFPETGDIDQNRSDASVQIGYFIIDSLEVNIGFDARISHGGINFVDYPDLPMVVQTFHDPLLKERAFLIGGGIGYAIIESLSIEAFARVFLAGANTRNGHVFGLGVNWTVF